MPPALAEALLVLVAAYLAAGSLFAAAFHWRGIGRLDDAAARGTLGFRVLVTPGVIALWPALVRRWRAASRAGGRS